MKIITKVTSLALSASMILSMVILLAACSPKVGSKEWCEDMKEKPKGEWTVDETASYAKHCIFK